MHRLHCDHCVHFRSVAVSRPLSAQSAALGLPPPCLPAAAHVLGLPVTRDSAWAAQAAGSWHIGLTNQKSLRRRQPQAAPARRRSQLVGQTCSAVLARVCVGARSRRSRGAPGKRDSPWALRASRPLRPSLCHGPHRSSEQQKHQPAAPRAPRPTPLHRRSTATAAFGSARSAARATMLFPKGQQQGRPSHHSCEARLRASRLPSWPHPALPVSAHTCRQGPGRGGARPVHLRPLLRPIRRR